MIIIILTLACLPLLANCQIDSVIANEKTVWVEGDHIAMSKERAVSFINMEDSLVFFRSKLKEYDNVLQDAKVALFYSDETIKSLIEERDLYAQKVFEVEQKLGLETEKNLLQSNRIASIVLQKKNIQRKYDKVKVQRDWLIGGVVGTTVIAIVAVLISAL